MLVIKRLLCVIFLFVCGFLQAQQEVNRPGPEDLITPMNLKPLSLEDFARRKGVTSENPARNLVIVFASGLLDETGVLFRSCELVRKLQIDDMEGFQQVLPRFPGPVQETDLIDLVSSSKRAVGLVSDMNFSFSQGNGVAGLPSAELFQRCKLALTMSRAKDAGERDALVNNFSGRNLEYAFDRRGLDRLFSAKAEKIIGVFEHGQSLDADKPSVVELVTAALSRLSVEENGFVLIVSMEEAQKAAEEGRLLDMIEQLHVQERVLHQVNSFVSGRKDTLFLLFGNQKTGLKIGNEAELQNFCRALKGCSSLFRANDLNKETFEKFKQEYDIFSHLAFSEAETGEIARQSLKNLLQNTLREKFFVSGHRLESRNFISGFSVFSRGHGAELFTGLVDYRGFCERLRLIAGLSSGE